MFLESEHPVGTELEVPFQTTEEKSSDCGHHCLHVIGKEILQNFYIISRVQVGRLSSTQSVRSFESGHDRPISTGTSSLEPT